MMPAASEIVVRGGIARLAAGGEQAILFAGPQAPVARASAGRQLDVAHRIVDIDAPFLARHLEDVAEQDQVPFHGRQRKIPTMFKLECSRLMIARLLGAEILIILAESGVLTL